MPDIVSNSDIDAILRRQISSGAAQEKCERNDPNEISAYLEGALSSKRVADFEQHLVSCGPCRRTVVELSALSDEFDAHVKEAVNSDVKADTNATDDLAPGLVERLRRFLFGTGGTGYMWRPAAAMVMILLIVGAPALLFLRQARDKAPQTAPVAANQSDKPATDNRPLGTTGFTDSSPGIIAPGDTSVAVSREHSPGNTVVAQPTSESPDTAEKPIAATDKASGGPPAAAPPPPPASVPAVVAKNEDKDVPQPKPVPEKQLNDEELNKVQRQADAVMSSNQSYGATLIWNVTVSMTPVESQSSLGLIGRRGEGDSPDRGVGGGARGADTQPPAGARSAPATKSTDDRESRARTDDAKRKETVAKKPAESAVPYDKRVGQILKARFDKYMEDKVRSGTGVTIKFRVRTDGTVISLKDGKVPDSDILKRSSNDVINTAVMKAIAEGKLPAFGENEKDYSQIILVIKFDPIVN